MTFVIAAAMKFAGHPRSLATRDRLAISPVRWRLIGGLELLGAGGALIGLAFPPLGIAALSALLLLSCGALGFHVANREPALAATPAVLAVLVSAGALAAQITAA